MEVSYKSAAIATAPGGLLAYRLQVTLAVPDCIPGRLPDWMEGDMSARSSEVFQGTFLPIRPPRWRRAASAFAARLIGVGCTYTRSSPSRCSSAWSRSRLQTRIRSSSAGWSVRLWCRLCGSSSSPRSSVVVDRYQRGLPLAHAGARPPPRHLCGPLAAHVAPSTMDPRDAPACRRSFLSSSTTLKRPS